MRSGKLKASNDYLINELINDANYDLREDGTIYTLIQCTGKRSVVDNWRVLGYKKTDENYIVIAYKNKRLQLGRVIYAKFNGTLQEDLTVNHKDGNPSNNHKDNLELVTQSENNKHAYKLGKKPVYGNTVLSFEIANEIREKKKLGLTHKQLCEEYGLSKGHISEIVNNKIWI